MGWLGDYGRRLDERVETRHATAANDIPGGRYPTAVGVVGMLIGPPAIIGLSVHGNPLPWWAAVYSGQVVLAAIVGIALSVRRRLATPKRNPLAERIVGVI